MFLHVGSLTNSVTMALVMKLTEVTGVNAFDDGYETVREHVEVMVSEFVKYAELRAFQTGRFSYVHDDTLSDIMTDIVLRELHKQSGVHGVVDVTDTVKRYCTGLASAFDGDWNYRHWRYQVKH